MDACGAFLDNWAQSVYAVHERYVNDELQLTLCNVRRGDDRGGSGAARTTGAARAQDQLSQGVVLGDLSLKLGAVDDGAALPRVSVSGARELVGELLGQVGSNSRVV